MTPVEIQKLRAKFPNAPESFFARQADGLPAPRVAPTSPGRRVRQSARPLLNGLETEWQNVLKVQYPDRIIHAQDKRYRLANGLWYKPDFTALVVDLSLVAEVSLRETAWEVKGPFAFRGGFENLKMAASTFPDVKFVLVWKDAGRWKEQIILP